MEDISANFPDGITYEIPFDATTYIRQSIKEVYKTLFEALILVILVVFLSLQSWRATLIPAIAVPISLIGTFGVMLLFGFSLNMLTLLGLVLAIGTVVDDFNLFNRVYRVYIQADAPYRSAQEDLNLFFVKGTNNSMIPITSLGTKKYTTGPGTTKRFKLKDKLNRRKK